MFADPAQADLLPSLGLARDDILPHQISILPRAVAMTHANRKATWQEYHAQVSRDIKEDINHFDYMGAPPPGAEYVFKLYPNCILDLGNKIHEDVNALKMVPDAGKIHNYLPGKIDPQKVSTDWSKHSSTFIED